MKYTWTENTTADSLFIRTYTVATDHIRWTVLHKNEQNFSNPYFLATKIWWVWKVVVVSQDIPWCKDVEPYNFPVDIVYECFVTNTTTKKLK
jgi:hypothetical protein